MKKMKRWGCLALSLSLLMVGLPGSMSVQAEEVDETEDVVYVTFDFNYPGTTPFVLPVEKGEMVHDALLEFEDNKGVDMLEVLSGGRAVTLEWNPEFESESIDEWYSLEPEEDITLYAKPTEDLSEEVFYNLTIDYDGHGENVVIPFIEEGTNLNQINGWEEIWKPRDGVYAEGGYRAHFLGPKPITEYDSWEDWYNYQENFDLVEEGRYSSVHEDTTLYVQWYRGCSPTEVTYSLPSDGDIVHIPDYPDGDWDWEQQTNRPVLALPKDVEGVKFTCEEGVIGNWVQVDDSDLPQKYETVQEDKFATPFEGTMKKGESYYASFIYELKAGYTFGIPELTGLPENVEVVVNNDYEPIVPDKFSGLAIPRWITVLKVTPEDKPVFADVDFEKGWEYPYVSYVYNKGYMTGKGIDENGQILFDPNSNVTRAELAQVLYSMEGRPEIDFTPKFSDVKENAWYAKAVCWAEKNGIVAGKGTLFDPNAPATREEAITMLYKYAQYSGRDTKISKDISEFRDADQVSSWAVDRIKWAFGAGLITGKDGIIDPQGGTRRSECAVLLKNLDNN